MMQNRRGWSGAGMGRKGTEGDMKIKNGRNGKVKGEIGMGREELR